MPAGGVIVSNKTHVCLNPEAIQTDVAEYLTALRKAAPNSGRVERIQALHDALGLYRGDLLPGVYEEWAQTEQRRLAASYHHAVESLTGLLEEVGDLSQAIVYARRSLSLDPLREESHQRVMRLCAAAGQSAAALEQYRELEGLLSQELGAKPTLATRQLARDIERSAHEPVARASRGLRPNENNRAPTFRAEPSPSS